VVNGISVLEEGLRKNPHDIDLILATATSYRVYAALSNDMAIVSQAENYYSLAIRKNPLSTNPRRGMLGLLMPLEKYDEAIEHATTILQIDPNDDEVKFRLAQAYEKTGRAGRARQLYKELLAKYPDRSDIKDSLALYERAKAAE
jgi:tetratricopeptide (TPR) repeat protein